MKIVVVGGTIGRIDDEGAGGSGRKGSLEVFYKEEESFWGSG